MWLPPPHKTHSDLSQRPCERDEKPKRGRDLVCRGPHRTTCGVCTTYGILCSNVCMCTCSRKSHLCTMSQDLSLHKKVCRQPQHNLFFPYLQEQWASSLHTLDLTLAEVVHIRTVLTKAELEGLTIDAGLREDLERAKVCFLCMKVKFGIFNWSYTCQLCQHAVCSGCLTKVRRLCSPLCDMNKHSLLNFR